MINQTVWSATRTSNSYHPVNMEEAKEGTRSSRRTSDGIKKKNGFGFE